jgi:hypothetical protein
MFEPTDPEVERLLAESASRAFAPGFADRVMDRVAADVPELVSPRQFVRMAAGVVIAVLLLGGYCLTAAGEDRSAIEALLGLPNAEQPASIYDLDAMSILTRSDSR